jgi:hypothetical protein
MVAHFFTLSHTPAGSKLRKQGVFQISVDLGGREVRIKYITKSPLFADGSRDVYFEVMGLPRTVNIVDVKGCETGKNSI